MLLLDTHALLWWLADDPALSPAARATIAAGQTQVFVSAASAWEMSIKRAQGKLGLDHGVGHPVPSDLPHGSPRRTEGRWRELDRCQNRGKHTTRFLPEKPLRRCRPV